MELVQIIYTILIFGGALLLIVVAFSYLLSRSKNGNRKNSYNNINYTSAPRRVHSENKHEQPQYRKDVPVQPVIVYPIDPRIHKDLKIHRKPSITKKEIYEKRKEEEAPIRRTNGYGKRYTIINEEMKKTFRPNVINF